MARLPKGAEKIHRKLYQVDVAPGGKNKLTSAGRNLAKSFLCQQLLVLFMKKKIIWNG